MACMHMHYLGPVAAGTSSITVPDKVATRLEAVLRYQHVLFTLESQISSNTRSLEIATTEGASYHIGS